MGNSISCCTTGAAKDVVDPTTDNSATQNISTTDNFAIQDISTKDINKMTNTESIERTDDWLVKALDFTTNGNTITLPDLPPEEGMVTLNPCYIDTDQEQL